MFNSTAQNNGVDQKSFQVRVIGLIEQLKNIIIYKDWGPTVQIGELTPNLCQPGSDEHNILHTQSNHNQEVHQLGNTEGRHIM